MTIFHLNCFPDPETGSLASGPGDSLLQPDIKVPPARAKDVFFKKFFRENLRMRLIILQ